MDAQGLEGHDEASETPQLSFKMVQEVLELSPSTLSISRGHKHERETTQDGCTARSDDPEPPMVPEGTTLGFGVPKKPFQICLDQCSDLA